MKKTVAFLLGFGVACGMAIGGWYYVRTSNVESEAAAQDARKEAATMVPVKLVVKAPAETPANQLLYICGSAPTMGNWESSAGVPLEKQPDGSWTGVVEVMSGVNYSFKVNRGTWDTVERGPNDTDVPNHDFTAEPDKTVEVQVAAWVDHGKTEPGRITTTGSIVLHTKFPSKQLGQPRDVVVYLPPGYDEDDESRYPVIYVQDGQNLFNEASSFAGIEWKMDETAQRLIQSKQVRPMIIVGIYNAGENRTSEFTPPGMNTGVKDETPTMSAKSRGDLYGKFIVEELKPFVDQRYRTMPDREHTTIGGSAMGGLISLYVAKSNPDMFGAVGVCSPWLRGPTGDRKLTPDLAGDSAWMKRTRFYVDMGAGGKGAGYPPNTAPPNTGKPEVVRDASADARELVAAFDAAGLVPGTDYTFEEVPGGEFNETAWQSRVEPMLKALFPAGAAPATQPSAQ